MGIFGHTWDKYKNPKYVVSEEGLQFASNIINEALAEMYIEESSEEVVEEGANIDMLKVFSDYKKQYRELNKKYRGYFKAKDFDKAKEVLKEMKALVKQTKKDINKIDQTAGSAIISVAIETAILAATIVIGYHIGVKGGLAVAKKVSMGAGSAVAATAGAITGAAAGTDFGTILGNFISELIKIKNGKAEMDAGTFNAFKNKINGCLTMTETGIEDAEKSIKMYWEKNDKEEEK